MAEFGAEILESGTHGETAIAFSIQGNRNPATFAAVNADGKPGLS